MGKKKDKSKKSKTDKNKTETVMEPSVNNIQPAELESESVAYEEYVTAEDVMALINSLEQGLERLDKSNQLLREQISQIKPAPRRHNGVFIFVTLILVIGIAMAGYYGFKSNAYIVNNATITAADIDRISARIDAVDASIRIISDDLNNFNSSLELLSANMAAINQNVSKMAGHVSKINTSDINTPYNRYVGRPLDNRQQWR
jgi:hypothetical protein